MPSEHNPNRVSVTSIAGGEYQPAPSPTGTPVVPPKVVPWLAVAVALAALVPTAFSGLPAWALGLCSLIVAVGSIFGIVSPGLRK